MGRKAQASVEKPDKLTDKTVGSDLSIVNQNKLVALLTEALAGDEPRFVLYNPSGQAMVLTSDRVIIGKVGMGAGAMFGGKVSQFYFADIINVAVQKNMVTAWVEIQTAAHQSASIGDYWQGVGSLHKGTGVSPVSAENTLPGNKWMVANWQPYLDELRGLIREARQPAPVQVHAMLAAESDVASQLAKIAELHAAGVLSADEFAAAKARIIG